MYDEQHAIETEYVVDKRETLYANLLWIMHLFAVIGFAWIALTKITDFKDETIRLIYTIVMLFIVLRLLSFIKSPRVMLRHR